MQHRKLILGVEGEERQDVYRDRDRKERNEKLSVSV